jgi:phosphatidylethanolamine/phosphatidyl-N-methylethanolamine N-methyltransferase
MRYQDWWFFFNNFLKHPVQIGYLLPSSRYLEDRISAAANLDTAKYIIELGPGTGGTTRSILKNMRDDAKLLVVEINSDFCAHISTHITDSRLHIFNGSAEDLEVAISELGWESIDAVLSGIPFSSIGEQTGKDIIQSINNVLSKKGRFVAYQLRDTVKRLGRKIMGRPSTQIEPRNFPPLRIFVWSKP